MSSKSAWLMQLKVGLVEEAFSVVSILYDNVVMAPLKPSLESCIGEEPSDLVVEEEAQNFGERNLIF
nr:hypothetical protein Iba_chr07bCG7480 [Ipomoea batatas]